MPVNVNDRDPSAVLFICKSKIHLNYLPTFSSKKAARMEQPGYTHSFTFLPSAYGKTKEGIVIRVADSFKLDDFPNYVCKWVRPNHVQTDEHWTKNWHKATLITNNI
jgi:hypothetical protein